MARNKRSPKQVAQDLNVLLNAGYNVPLPALAYVQQQELRERGVKQFYRCSKCGFPYEAMVPISDIRCPKGHVMKKIWDL